MSEYRIQSETLEGIADSIREKTGGSALIAPEDMAMEIASISGGGGSGVLEGINDLVFGTSAINLSTANISNHKLVVDLTGKNVTFSSNVFSACPDSTLDVEIICNKITLGSNPFSLSSTGNNGRSVTLTTNQEYIYFSGQHFTSGTGGAKQFPSFYGVPISIASSDSSNYGKFSRANIKHISFWENCAIGVMYFGGSSSMDTSTIISLANALKAERPNTVTYHATPKAKLSTIMGTIESVTRDEETYDRFVEDENGTVTLLDFITNTKGWTVA